MIVIDEIRQNLISELKQMDMTQKELGQKLNISSVAVNHYLNQNKLPALDTFANLCVVLDLDANEVLGINKARQEK
ncbi:MAG: helix-turn-helix transcriptional regulator [Clostridia bacterium]|nr:helix-turn-helix transcriptional regulator [Clostridia bacterium]